MAYKMPTDADNVRFFGKKTSDGNDAFMPTQIVGPDGKTPIYSEEGRLKVDAQLTGSNVLISEVEDVTVTAGTITEVSSNPLDVSNYVYLYAQVTRDTPHTYKYRNYIKRPNGTNIKAMEQGEDTANLTTDEFRPGSTLVGMGIENTDTVDHVYTVRLYGLKA